MCKECNKEFRPIVPTQNVCLKCWKEAHNDGFEHDEVEAWDENGF